LGAAFTCAHLGLSTEPRADHAQYIQSWLRVLRADKRAIFTAASKAQQACDWLVQPATRWRWQHDRALPHPHTPRKLAGCAAVRYRMA
jgi:antirestriction protein ArdC